MENIQSDEQKTQKFQTMAQNTLDMQQMNASDYNHRAQELGDENWRQAYRRDILGKELEEQKTNIVPQSNIPSIIPESAKVVDNGVVTVKNENKAPQTNENTQDNTTQAQEQNNTVTVQNNESKNEGDTQNSQNIQNAENTQETSTKNVENPQTVDYENWNVEDWKARGSNASELETAIEKKYNTVLEKDTDGNFTGVIGDTKYKWTIDASGNPSKTVI